MAELQLWSLQKTNLTSTSLYYPLENDIQGQAGKPWYHSPGYYIVYDDQPSVVIDNLCYCKYRSKRIFSYFTYVGDNQLTILPFFTDDTLWHTSNSIGYNWQLFRGYLYDDCYLTTTVNGVWSDVPLIPYYTSDVNLTVVLNQNYPSPNNYTTTKTGYSSLKLMKVFSGKCCNGKAGCGVLTLKPVLPISDLMFMACLGVFNISFDPETGLVIDKYSVEPFDYRCDYGHHDPYISFTSCYTATQRLYNFINEDPTIPLSLQPTLRQCKECRLSLNRFLGSLLPLCVTWRLYTWLIDLYSRKIKPTTVPIKRNRLLFKYFPSYVVGYGDGCGPRTWHTLDPIWVCLYDTSCGVVYQWVYSDLCGVLPDPPTEIPWRSPCDRQCGVVPAYDYFQAVSDSFGRDSMDPPCNIPLPPPYQYKKGRTKYGLDYISKFNWQYFDVYKTRLIRLTPSRTASLTVGGLVKYGFLLQSRERIKWLLQDSKQTDYQTLKYVLKNRAKSTDYYYTIVKYNTRPDENPANYPNLGTVIVDEGLNSLYYYFQTYFWGCPTLAQKLLHGDNYNGVWSTVCSNWKYIGKLGDSDNVLCRYRLVLDNWQDIRDSLLDYSRIFFNDPRILPYAIYTVRTKNKYYCEDSPQPPSPVARITRIKILNACQYPKVSSDTLYTRLVYNKFISCRPKCVSEYYKCLASNSISTVLFPAAYKFLILLLCEDILNLLTLYPLGFVNLDGLPVAVVDGVFQQGECLVYYQYNPVIDWYFKRHYYQVYRLQTGLDIPSMQMEILGDSNCASYWTNTAGCNDPELPCSLNNCATAQSQIPLILLCTKILLDLKCSSFFEVPDLIWLKMGAVDYHQDCGDLIYQPFYYEIPSPGLDREGSYGGDPCIYDRREDLDDLLVTLMSPIVFEQGLTPPPQGFYTRPPSDQPYSPLLTIPIQWDRYDQRYISVNQCDAIYCVSYRISCRTKPPYIPTISLLSLFQFSYILYETCSRKLYLTLKLTCEELICALSKDYVGNLLLTDAKLSWDANKNMGWYKADTEFTLPVDVTNIPGGVCAILCLVPYPFNSNCQLKHYSDSTTPKTLYLVILTDPYYYSVLLPDTITMTGCSGGFDCTKARFTVTNVSGALRMSYDLMVLCQDSLYFPEYEPFSMVVSCSNFKFISLTEGAQYGISFRYLGGVCTDEDWLSALIPIGSVHELIPKINLDNTITSFTCSLDRKTASIWIYILEPMMRLSIWTSKTFEIMEYGTHTLSFDIPLDSRCTRYDHNQTISILLNVTPTAE